MQTMNKGGDVLARGNARCQFAPMGGGVSQEKWDAMWTTESDSGDTNAAPTGDASPNSGETAPRKETQRR